MLSAGYKGLCHTEIVKIKSMLLLNLYLILSYLISPACTKEELNYLRVCYIVSRTIEQGLRSIFKQEWDNRYKTTLGEWQDTQKNGLDFFNAESSANQKRHVGFLATMKKGDTAEWDCTMLFHAILYSNSIYDLDQQIRSNVDDLRKFRNTYFAHVAGGRLSDLLFEDACRIVESAFHALGLPVAQIQTIKTSSLTDLESPPVLTNIEEEPYRLRREVHVPRAQEKFTNPIDSEKEQLHKQSFCILPPVPPHQIAGREGDVATIVNQLDNLRDTNKNRLSYFYISGNPGSGKSQLARLVAKRVYDKTIDGSSSPSFVKTLNAENRETLLESYVSLATIVSCPEPTVTSIHSSKDKAIEEKINNLRKLIGTKISFYESWLLVVDNVTSLPVTLGFLPELGNEQWGNGQLLITTQDCSCIPPDSSESLCCHISISQGMTSEASGFLLVTISGIKDDTTAANEVAKALDHQPLALASAAFYVAKVREHRPKFGWNDYLKKLNEGKGALTEEVLAKASQIYPKTMTAAIQIAVKRELKYDEVMKHVFTFLSFCAPHLLGDLQCEMCDYQEAEKNLRLALSIYLERLSPNHVDVGRTYYHLGILQYLLANMQQAKKYLEKAHSILLEKLGTEHSEVARVYYRMGDVEYELKEIHQAKKHFELALPIFEKQLGPDSTEVKQTTLRLSLCDKSP